jgi:hypothetical protein
VIKRSSGRGLISPAGLVLALFCFGLPFLTVSCETPVMSVSADYTGWDFVVAGEPHVTTSGPGGDVAGRQHDASIPWQPLALAAVLVVIGGIVLTFASPRNRRATGIVTGSVAAVLVIANQGMARNAVVSELKRSYVIPPWTIDKLVDSRIGYWLTLAVLACVVGYNVLELALELRAPASPGRPPD